MRRMCEYNSSLRLYFNKSNKTELKHNESTSAKAPNRTKLEDESFVGTLIDFRDYISRWTNGRLRHRLKVIPHLDGVLVASKCKIRVAGRVFVSIIGD